MRPLLAANADLSKIKYPVLVSPKLDGIRCLIVDHVPVSRKLKPIPNRFIRDKLSGIPSYDGELIVGSPTDKECFNKTSSAVMSFDGDPDFKYYIFDWHDMPGKYSERLWYLHKLELPNHICIVDQHLCTEESDIIHWEEYYISQGYEGIMIRSFDGKYKFGRSTVNEGILLKFKRFTDFEAVIVGFEERLNNNNERTKDNLGYTKRSSHQENKIPNGTLGSFICKSDKYTETFKVGTGLSDSDRYLIWIKRNSYMNKVIKVKSQICGEKDRPRFPVFLGFRLD